MQKLNSQKGILYLLVVTLLLLTSCGEFPGLRTPRYDGEPVKPDTAAIEAYRMGAEVTGAAKEYYIRYPFSEDILQKSREYPSEEPFLLEAGRYLIGEDLAAGRATLLGNESSFSTENYDVHVGNLIIRDAAGEVYFENLFHSEYGQLTAQVDLLPGHEITIIGTDPEITVFYEEALPRDPYLLMEPPILIQTLDRLNVQQPLQILEEGKVVYLTAGIYEVGLHFEEGTYRLSDLVAPHNTELYLFRENSSPQVIELLMGNMEENIEPKQKEGPEIELLAGDKIYLNLVKQLALISLEEK